MHDPRSRIISLERNHHVSRVGKQNNITTWWSLEIEVQAVRKLVDVILLKNSKVMTVQVNLIAVEPYENNKNVRDKSNECFTGCAFGPPALFLPVFGPLSTIQTCLAINQ